jgi:hypothetical protein
MKNFITEIIGFQGGGNHCGQEKVLFRNELVQPVDFFHNPLNFTTNL